jgi:uncharacterized protein with PQ loop repeat
MEFLGWLGAFLLAFCAVPELYSTLRTKKCGLTWGFLNMWLFGEIFTLVPVVSKQLGTFLIFNYSLNIVIILILCYYKIRSKRNV